MHQMERNAPRVAERVWNIVRLAFFMMGKGISKRKLIDHAMKRGKLAGKAMIGSLLFHHHHHSHGGSASFPSTSPYMHDGRLSFPSTSGDYEFSCSSSPAKRRGCGNNHGHWHFFSCVHPPQDTDEDDSLATLNAVKIAIEMWSAADQAAVEEQASPVSGIGFGVSPAVGQLLRVRVTDSPFPLGDLGGDSSHVDEAAGEFIERFRKELERQMKIEMTASKQ